MLIFCGLLGLLAMVVGLFVNKFTARRCNLALLPVVTILVVYLLFVGNIYIRGPRLDTQEKRDRVAYFLGERAFDACLPAVVLWLVGRRWNRSPKQQGGTIKTDAEEEGPGV